MGLRYIPVDRMAFRCYTINTERANKRLYTTRIRRDLPGMDGEGGRKVLNRDRSLPVWLWRHGFFRVIHRLSTALTPGFGVIHRISTGYPQVIHRVIHNRSLPVRLSTGYPQCRSELSTGYPQTGHYRCGFGATVLHYTGRYRLTL
jgi:hypothetical protein